MQGRPDCMQRFAQQDTTEMNVEIHSKTIKNPSKIGGKSIQNCSWEAVGELWDAILSSSSDSEAFGVLQEGQRELLGSPWGGLGAPLKPTRGALGSFWPPFGSLWKAFGVPQSAKADSLIFLVLLSKSIDFACPGAPRSTQKRSKIALGTLLGAQKQERCDAKQFLMPRVRKSEALSSEKGDS